MKMFKIRFNSLLSSVVLAICCFGLMACGGGGGGDSAGGGSSTSAYQGLTTPAAITNDNAGEISLHALSVQSANVGVLSETDSKEADVSGLVPIPQVVSSVLSGRTAESGKIVAQVTASESGSIPGGCGGSASYSITIDEGTLDFDMTLNFKSYCESGVTISGATTVTGHVSGMSDINMTMTGSQLLVADNATHKVCQYKDYSFYFSVYGSTLTFAVSGTFYDPDNGYVYCTTLTPFEVDDYTNNHYPSSGSLKIVEDNGAPDSAILTALDNVQCQIDIDLGNDGAIDQTVIKDWASLDMPEAGITYDVWGGNVLDLNQSYYNVDKLGLGFVKLGTGICANTATFYGAYDYYVVAMENQNSHNLYVDTAQESGGSYYPQGSIATGNVLEGTQGNAFGPPDSQYLIMQGGVSLGGSTYRSYTIFYNPGNWTSFKLYTACD